MGTIIPFGYRHNRADDKSTDCKQRPAGSVLQKDVQERVTHAESNTKSKLGYQSTLLTPLNGGTLNAPGGIIAKKGPR